MPSITGKETNPRCKVCTICVSDALSTHSPCWGQPGLRIPIEIQHDPTQIDFFFIFFSPQCTLSLRSLWHRTQPRCYREHPAAHLENETPGPCAPVPRGHREPCDLPGRVTPAPPSPHSRRWMREGPHAPINYNSQDARRQQRARLSAAWRGRAAVHAWICSSEQQPGTQRVPRGELASP